MDELQQIRAEIVEFKAELSQSKEKGDRDLILMYGNMLATAEKRLAIKEEELLLQKKTHLSVGTGGFTGPMEELKATVKEAVRQVLAEQKEDAITFSTCSEGKLRSFLRDIHVTVNVGDTSEWTTTKVFKPFQWQAVETEDMPRAKTHIENQLKEFGVQFGRGNYQLHNVHTSREILSVEDPKIGNIKGGTDLIICPYGKHMLSIIDQSCVAIELKTSESIIKNGFSAFTAQATLELIASNYYSNQMTVVLLTDLCTGAMIYTLERTVDDNISVIVYENCSLSEAAMFIANHLNECCVPERDYNLKNGRKATDDVLRLFKKKRVSPPEDSVVWEHFQDMLPDTEPCSRERAEIIGQLYNAYELPLPAVCRMYS